ncbi:hypothetical protein MUO66_02220 [Candidatus Bathyarchaeota archaeon]|nr:hypothetical protein [Candidatus Bathyarchaeota archaeon]
MKQKIIEKKTNEFAIETDIEQNETKTLSLRELIDSLKSIADDIGQISEMTSEEKLLVEGFFKSLLELMQPLTQAMLVSPDVLPVELGNISKAFIDPTGHLALFKEEGDFELKNLAKEQNRDLMISVVQYVLPKFRSLITEKKVNIENRINFLSTITNEIQKISSIITGLLNDNEE